ncbi:MAG: hypothetical protein MUE75_14170 [Algoriphagus sp.]|nr:hypothetical protein [Algoriphagus sp.]
MTKSMFHIALLIFMVMLSTVAKAQFVAVRLEIPAGVQFSAQVMDPLEGGTWEKTKAKRWVELEADENLSVLVQLQLPQREIQPATEAFFLNDGSSDFENASLLDLESSEVRLSATAMLMRYMNPVPRSIKAWLGLPVIDGLTIRIEYP